MFSDEARNTSANNARPTNAVNPIAAGPIRARANAKRSPPSLPNASGLVGRKGGFRARRGHSAPVSGAFVQRGRRTDDPIAIRFARSASNFARRFRGSVAWRGCFNLSDSRETAPKRNARGRRRRGHTRPASRVASVSLSDAIRCGSPADEHAPVPPARVPRARGRRGRFITPRAIRAPETDVAPPPPPSRGTAPAMRRSESLKVFYVAVSGVDAREGAPPRVRAPRIPPSPLPSPASGRNANLAASFRSPTRGDRSVGDPPPPRRPSPSPQLRGRRARAHGRRPRRRRARRRAHRRGRGRAERAALPRARRSLVPRILPVQHLEGVRAPPPPAAPPARRALRGRPRRVRGLPPRARRSAGSATPPAPRARSNVRAVLPRDPARRASRATARRPRSSSPRVTATSCASVVGGAGRASGSSAPAPRSSPGTARIASRRRGPRTSFGTAGRRRRVGRRRRRAREKRRRRGDDRVTRGPGPAELGPFRASLRSS